MKAINIEISKLNNNNGQIKDVPKNPRFLRDAKFAKLKKSIQDFPEMLAYREIVCYDNDGEYVVIGGNMRLRACKDLGYKEVPCKIFPAGTDVKRLREFVIKDNYGFGENDMDMLANEWDELELIDFCFDEIELGMDVAEERAKDIKNEKLNCFEKTHILISFPPEKLLEIQDFLEKIKSKEFVDYEQSSN